MDEFSQGGPAVRYADDDDDDEKVFYNDFIARAIVVAIIFYQLIALAQIRYILFSRRLEALTHFWYSYRRRVGYRSRHCRSSP